MGNVRGAVRLFTVVLMVLLGAVLMVPLTLIPFRYQGARVSAWWVVFLVRGFNRIFDVRFRCNNPALLRWHSGLLFPNHSSYLDVMAMMTTAPARFLAAIEMRRRPVIGWIAASIDCVFVERENSQSRRAARRSVSAVLQANPYPPVVIFPEGKLDPGTSLYPFRYGAFELAVQNQVAYIPVALRYNRPDVVTWYGGLRNESMTAAIWRLAKHRGRIAVDVILLDPVRPSKADDPALLAAVAQRAIERELGFPPRPTHVESPVLPRPARAPRAAKKKDGADEAPQAETSQN